MKAVLISLNEIDLNRRIEIDKDIFRIGRSDDNDLVLPKKYISRRHAMIELRDGQYVLKDLGSRNPTFVNQIPITEHVLQDGDLIEICDFRFRVEVQQDALAIVEDDEDPDGTALWDPQSLTSGPSINSIQVGGALEAEEESSETNRSSVLQPISISSSPADPPPISFSDVEMNIALVEESEEGLEASDIKAESLSISEEIEEESAIEFEPLDITAPVAEEESDLDIEGFVEVGGDFNSSPSPSFQDDLSVEIEDEEEETSPPELSLQEDSDPPSLPLLDIPLDSEDEPDEFEGTAVVDLSAVIANVPPPLEKEEEEEEDEEEEEGFASFTGSLSELLAKKKSRKAPSKSSKAKAPPPPPPPPVPVSVSEDEEEEEEEEPKVAFHFQAPTLQPTSTDLDDEEDDEDDDDDEGTALVEIQVGDEDDDGDEDEDDDGTDVLSAGGDEREKTAQLAAVKGPKKRKGKLASADAVVVASGEVEEDDEDDDEDSDYLDLDQTGSFDVQKFRAKKENRKKREIFVAVGICSAIFIILLAGYHLLTSKKKPKIEDLDPLKLVAGENRAKEWRNPRTNPIAQVIFFTLHEGKKSKKVVEGKRGKDIYEDDYILVVRVLTKWDPTFFIFVPKEGFPKDHKMSMVVKYKDGFVQRFPIFVRPAPKKLSRKEKVLKSIENLSSFERRKKANALKRSADKIWDDRHFPGNEHLFEEARRKYEEALWIVESYKPDGFDEEWDREFKLIKDRLEEATKEKEEFLERLQEEFFKFYRSDKRRKALERLNQILKLLSHDKNSIAYIQYNLYRKYLYKQKR